MTRGEIVAANNVEKRFDAVLALTGVSFTWFGPGLVGILGPNGAGKTTLLDILSGLTAPSSGEVRVFGKPPVPYPRARVGVVLQREFVMDGISVAEYAELFAAIQRVPGGAARIVREANLEQRERSPVARLSGGEAARLFVAAAVVHDPDVLFLDEPTAHLDPEHKQRMGELLTRMARERLVVLTTHDLREANALCDRLMFLVGGRVRAEGPREELVAAVPAALRRGLPVEDAFFHFCAARIVHGELEEQTR